MTDRGKRPNVARIVLVVCLIALWSFLIIVRLAQLQIFQHEHFVQRANTQQLVTQEIRAPRGVIYDSHMNELATSVIVNTVEAEPRHIGDIPAAARALAPILGLEPEKLQRRMSDPERQTFMVVKRRIDPNDEPRIEALGIRGVYLVNESMRVYPNRNLACHALGFVNMNGDGGAGLELRYDKELKGSRGQISFNVDAHRRSFRGKIERAPVQGHSLVVSLDRSIQFIAERELSAGVKKFNGTAGSAIVMESQTGRILALANYPDFNPNKYNEYPLSRHLNRSTSLIFEPGSTFKVVVAAAALEAGLTRPDEKIDCQMGFIKIGGHTFHDHKAYGLLSFTDVVVHSSNVGAAKLGIRLGRQRLYESLRTFGFGSLTGIDLPGEIVGLVRHWTHWSNLSIGAISFGHEIGVTGMQILVAINSIANGGYRVRPSIVDRVIDHKGELVRARISQRVRIMSPETAEAVRVAFEGVVLRGTGQAARLEGYRSAGKTGTAQKVVDGKYSNTKYVASFIGFAPLPDPKITVLTMVDEPGGAIYGGEVAAPIFREITREVLLQLHVPPNPTLPLPATNPSLAAMGAEDFIPNATPVVPWIVANQENPGEDPSEAIIMRVFDDSVAMPDFRGEAKREVVNRCQELGIQVQPHGSGIAVFQMPPPGTTIPVGDTCTVTFARGCPVEYRIVPGLDTGPPKVTSATSPETEH